MSSNIDPIAPGRPGEAPASESANDSPSRQRAHLPVVRITCLFLVVALVALLAGGNQHALRLIPASLLATFGLLLLFAWARKRPFKAFFAMMALTSCAVASWLFLLTIDGINRQYALATVQAASEVPIGDLEAFRIGMEERKEAGEQFPQLQKDIERVEKDWLVATYQQRVNDAIRTEPSAPKRIARLNRIAEELEPLDRHQVVGSLIEQSRTELRNKESDRMIRSFRDFLEMKKPDDALLEVQSYMEFERERRDLHGWYLDRRRDVFFCRLDIAREETGTLLRADRFAEAVRVADRFAEAMRWEAQETGWEFELNLFRQAVADLASLAIP